MKIFNQEPSAAQLMSNLIHAVVNEANSNTYHVFGQSSGPYLQNDLTCNTFFSPGSLRNK